MGRPSAITPAIVEAVERHRSAAGGLDALHGRLTAEGHALSRSSLARYLRTLGSSRGPSTPAAEPTGTGVGALARAAGAAVESGELGSLHRARDHVTAALEALGPKLGRDARAVRSYAALTRVAAEVARAIIDVTPRAPEERYAAVEGQALTELLRRARAAAEPGDELAALRDRVAAQAETIVRLASGDG